MLANLPERSHTILALASEAGIAWEPGAEEQFTDEALLRFVESYKRWAGDRDNALVRHISNTATYFRCHIPYSPRVFYLASQIVWYVDEIIIRDPLSVVFAHDLTNLQQAKADVLQVLRVLGLFYPHLESGYVLLAGDGVLPSA